MHKYRKKTIKFLFGYLLIFLAVFLWSYFSYQAKIAIINIGLGFAAIDIIAMIFSILSILFAIFEIIKVEHAKDYEEKIRNSI